MSYPGAAISLCLLGTELRSQEKSDYVYSPVIMDVLGEEAPLGQREGGATYFWGNSIDYATYAFTNVLRDMIANKKEQQQQAYESQQAMAKIAMIKSQYSSYSEYPDIIACLLYTSPSPRDRTRSRMPSSA